MVIASDLHAGTVIRIEGQIYKLLEAESKAGIAKMGESDCARAQQRTDGLTGLGLWS